jgi:hypothetical protein
MLGLLRRASRWLLYVTIIRGVKISRENFADIQRAIGRLVDELPEDGFTPRLVNSYWAKVAAIMVCHDESTKDWLAARIPTLVAVRAPGSR